MTSIKKAIYAGSFDPITKGHIDIIRRALAVFDEVEIVVGMHPSKKYTFDIQKRVELIKSSIYDSRLHVTALQGKLLADYAYEKDIKTIIKGARNAADFEYEKISHDVSFSQQRGIDTFILVSKAEYNHISSSAVKEICRYSGLIHDYVTIPVKAALEKEINGQQFLGVTGRIGAGKSYISDWIVNFARIYMPTHNIDLDKIGHEILFSPDAEPVYMRLREEIADLFGMKILDRKELGNTVFNDREKLDQLNKLMRVPILTKFRQTIANKKGLILVNAALLAEFNLLFLCNNNVLLVDTTKELCIQRLMKRGMTNEQIERRLLCQYTTDEKENVIKNQSRQDGYGMFYYYLNDRKSGDYHNFEKELGDILKYFVDL
jgi:pantetheine-phosphate adenylyltransferase